MIAPINFVTKKRTETQYQIVDDWGASFLKWCKGIEKETGWNHIVVFTDDQVWATYEMPVRNALASLDIPLVILSVPAGENSKDFDILDGAIGTLIENRIHRRDLLLCLGGGVCCDIGGLLASLYMRGMDYVNVPTSLMAQIDAAIGGKVGANRGLRKNILGGFHHPRLVLVDPVFLDTLPQPHFVAALAEAVKVAIIRDDQVLFDLLDRNTESLVKHERRSLVLLLEHCIKGKLALLAADPYEFNLDRELNLGHGVAHALEKLFIMPGDRQPLHGEAVSIGLAATARYAFRLGLCSGQRALKILSILSNLGLPLAPSRIEEEIVRDQLNRTVEHRGGVFRLVVPVEAGVTILPHADIDLLAECLFPVARQPL